MIEKIKNHAHAAANAHNVACHVYSGEEFEGDRFTGRFFVSVEFRQAVYTIPESKKGRVSEIERRRLIGVSAGDARRLFKARVGRPGGQEYILSRTASKVILHVADTPDEAERAVLDEILAGRARLLAHDVADEAAAIEVEMRAALREAIAATKNTQ